MHQITQYDRQSTCQLGLEEVKEKTKEILRTERRLGHCMWFTYMDDSLKEATDCCRKLPI